MAIRGRLLVQERGRVPVSLAGSYGPEQCLKYVSLRSPSGVVARPVTAVHGSKWPISN
jgi:hypothetical protein